MPAPAFGFSVGDFIAGIKLIKDLVDSLDEVSGAKPHFRRLVTELRNLERALTEVKALQVDASQTSQKLALEQVASQCQDCIQAFLKKNTKIQDAIGLQSTASTWRANLRKFQWAVCRQDTVDKFRAEIKGHVLTINTLLATIQLASTSLQNEASSQHRQESNEIRSLVKKNNDILNSHAGLIVTISRAVTSCATQQQTHDLQVIMQGVLETNMKIFQLILEMQKVQQMQMPLQIDRQQPVYFEDAHGRLAPFHTEFINSLEAFQAVMEVRFRHVPGLKKVQANRYIVKESNSKRVLNLRAPWESVFLPGRKVVMSMIFQMPQTTTTSCPGCQSENEVPADGTQGEIQCTNPNCGLWYERISEVEEGEKDATSDVSRRHGKRPASDTPESPAKRTRYSNGHARHHTDDQHDMYGDDSDDEDTVQQFKRVQVILTQQSELQMMPSTYTPSQPTLSLPSTPKPISNQFSDSELQSQPPELLVALQQVDNLKYFLISACIDWQPGQYIRRFLLPTGEYVSCVLWNNFFHISGTDICRCLSFRFQAFGRAVCKSKKFEEGIFSDLRNLRSGVDASLEESGSPFLEFLYKNNIVRTQRKQKVFYWYSVPHDRLFLDALERDLRKEAAGMEATTKAISEPALSFEFDASKSLFEQLTEAQQTFRSS